MPSADTHHAVVWPQGEGGGGSHVLRAVCDGCVGRFSEGSLEGGGFGGEGGAWTVEWWNNSVLIP